MYIFKDENSKLIIWGRTSGEKGARSQYHHIPYLFSVQCWKENFIYFTIVFNLQLTEQLSSTETMLAGHIHHI